MTWSTSNSFRVNCRVEQNTNAYEIHPPKTALGRLAEAVFGAKSLWNIATLIFREQALANLRS